MTSVAQSLHKLVIFDPKVTKDYFRLEGYLKDIYGSNHKTEVSLIVTAAKAGVIDLLDNMTTEKPLTIALYDIIKKIVTNNNLDKESAVWATVVWALSLQKVTEEDAQQLISTSCELSILEKNQVVPILPIMHNPVSNLNSSDSYSINHILDQGKKLHNQGKYSEAIACYDMALLINSLDHNILSDKGLSLHNQGKYSEAIACYDMALLINSQDEFIKRRRNNTLTLLYNQTRKQYLPQNKSQRSISPYSKSISSHIHVIGIIVAISGLSLGIAVYALIGAVYVVDSKSSIADNNDIHNSSTLKSEIFSPGITSNSKFDQDSLTEFTESIEEQIIKEEPSTKALSKNITKNQTPDEYLPNNVKGIENNKPDEINQKVDNFKLELEKAMESNFN